MLILAIDTTESTAAAAICDGERPVVARTVQGTMTHSEKMLPMIAELMAEAGLNPRDSGIELFACSAGPGSFTGVRIGVSIIKGLAFGRKSVLCSGVSALEALALNMRSFAQGDFYVCPVMDARRGRYYNAVFSVSGGEIIRLTDDRAVTSGELKDEIARRWNDRALYLCGGGTKLAEAEFAELDNVLSAPGELVCENGISVAVCAYRDFMGERKYVCDDRALSPVYLRPAQPDRID